METQKIPCENAVEDKLLFRCHMSPVMLKSYTQEEIDG
jgi:hypothetical protein